MPASAPIQTMSWSFGHASLDKPLASRVNADLLLLQDLPPLCPLARSPPLIFNIEVAMQDLPALALPIMLMRLLVCLVHHHSPCSVTNAAAAPLTRGACLPFINCHLSSQPSVAAAKPVTFRKPT